MDCDAPAAAASIPPAATRDGMDSDAPAAVSVPRFTLPELLASGAEALAAGLVAHGFVVISLSDPEASKVASTLQRIGNVIEPFHGCTPRVRRHTRIETSTWARRTLMRYLPNGPAQDDDETPSLAAAAAAAAEVAPTLLGVTRVATDAMACLEGQVLTDGQLDAFFYPDDDHDAADRVFEDRDCPCPSHTDPGIVTLVAERGANALEARDVASGEWQRVVLQPHEVCLVAGSQLAKLSAGLVTACVHRVAPTAHERVSYVFEVHLRVQEEEHEEAEQKDATAPIHSEAVTVHVRGQRGGGRERAPLGARASRLLGCLRGGCARLRSSWGLRIHQTRQAAP